MPATTRRSNAKGSINLIVAEATWRQQGWPQMSDAYYGSLSVDGSCKSKDCWKLDPIYKRRVGLIFGYLLSCDKDSIFSTARARKRDILPSICFFGGISDILHLLTENKFVGAYKTLPLPGFLFRCAHWKLLSLHLRCGSGHVCSVVSLSDLWISFGGILLWHK